MPEQVLVYGDCAVNPDPTAEELADIAIQSADSATAFGITPKVAMISYSTGESGSGADVEKVRTATEIAQREVRTWCSTARCNTTPPPWPRWPAEGPEQPGGRPCHRLRLSRPEHRQHHLQGGAAQRQRHAVGPMLQGLRKPVNDLSRGALVDDIVYTIALTAIQAQQGAVRAHVESHYRDRAGAGLVARRRLCAPLQPAGRDGRRGAGAAGAARRRAGARPGLRRWQVSARIAARSTAGAVLGVDASIDMVTYAQRQFSTEHGRTCASRWPTREPSTSTRASTCWCRSMPCTGCRSRPMRCGVSSGY